MNSVPITNEQELSQLLEKKANIENRINSLIERVLLRHYWNEQNQGNKFESFGTEYDIIRTHFTIPRVILSGKSNKEALSSIFIRTKANIQESNYGGTYLIDIRTEHQLMLLMKSYNWITEYHNNGDNKNTLFIRFKPHEINV